MQSGSRGAITFIALATALALPGCVAPPARYPAGGQAASARFIHLDRGRPITAATRLQPDETGLTQTQKDALFRGFADQQKQSSSD